MWVLDGLKIKSKSEDPAIITRMGDYTFRELWNKSEQIAVEINKSGKKTPVVLYGDKHIDMFPVMVAAIKTGRAYVPIDTKYPVERLKLIADTVDACLVYNFSGNDLDFPYTVYDPRHLHDVTYSRNIESEIPESEWIGMDDLCYILFTSGSTGVPKGVPITKSNILNYVEHDLLDASKYGSRAMLQVSLSFDDSVQSLHYYLSTGRTIVCIDKYLTDNIGEMIDYIEEKKINIWVSTPALANMCLNRPEFGCDKLPDIQVFYLSGETLNKNTAVGIRKLFPNAVIINSYGPTEATVEFVGCEVTNEMLESPDPIPIGYCMPEALYRIVREDGSDCNEEEPGELIVVSKSVANGYYKNPEKTAESFFRHEDGRMGYRTGDLVYEKNGLMYFIGRRDSQIKLNGYRVELGDIEENLSKIPYVSMNSVLPVYRPDNSIEYLVGIVYLDPRHPEKNHLKNNLDIKKRLKALVPSYMVPQKIIILDEELPMNVNGKIDQKKLRDMYIDQ